MNPTPSATVPRRLRRDRQTASNVNMGYQVRSMDFAVASEPEWPAGPRRGHRQKERRERGELASYKWRAPSSSGVHAPSPSGARHGGVGLHVHRLPVMSEEKGDLQRHFSVGGAPQKPLVKRT